MKTKEINTISKYFRTDFHEDFLFTLADFTTYYDPCSLLQFPSHICSNVFLLKSFLCHSLLLTSAGCTDFDKILYRCKCEDGRINRCNLLWKY